MKRVEHVDLLRAFGILLMVMGHVGFGPEFNHWIHIFHMPMFFVISGYFYKPQPFGTLLVKRFSTLLLPYLVFGLFHVGLYFVYTGGIDPHAFYLLFWENTAETGVPIAGALWFLTAMFLSELLFWGLQNLKLSLMPTTLIAAVIAVAGMVIAKYLPFRLPWAMDAALTGVGLYQIGRLLKEKGEKLLELNAAVAALGILLFSVLGCLNGYVNLREGTYGIWPLYWINVVGMTVSLWSFCKWIRDKAGKKGMALLQGIGRDSIVWLCLNQVVILSVKMAVGFLIKEPEGVAFYVLHFGIFLASAAVLLILQFVIMKTKLKVFVGKW